MLAVLFTGKTTLSGLFPRRALSDRPMLGAPMSVPGLAHEPLNEMGVILLFGLVALELGFICGVSAGGVPGLRSEDGS
jgi:hypothetical protein